MGITDKITGRVKQAAGDILGDEDLHRQGTQEERKADAKAELEKERARAEAAEAEADQRTDAAEKRAASAARREFERANASIERDEAKAQAARERAQRKAEEVDALQLSTDPGRLAQAHTREELQEQARRLGIEGRSTMTKDELAAEIARNR